MHKGSAVPYGSMCCTYHQLKYSSPKRTPPQKKTQQQQKPTKSHTKEPTVGKWRFREKEVMRMCQEQKRIRQKEQRTGLLGRRTKEEK